MEEELYIEVTKKESKLSMIGWGIAVFCAVGAIFFVWTTAWIW